MTIPDTLIELTSEIQQSVADPADQIRLLLLLCTYEPKANGPGENAVASATRRAALLALAQAVAAYNPTSSTEAQQIAATIGPLFEREITYAADRQQVTTYRQLKSLKTAVMDDLQTRGSLLPEVTSVQMPATMPAARCAQLVYRDGSRADEIVIRNNPIHPLMMPKTLEVLTY